MINTKQQVERRKHKRFQAWNGAFVALGPYSLKLGQIVNMSMGGLAFRYIGSRKPSRMKTESKIFIDNGFCLDDVPSLVMRQSGVQFGKLTRDQRSELEYFIHNHTAGAMA
ncbi:MAG: PilZ domain-containing protein [Deltaproteobacteria bacterium]|nr:PilZ domain-containing protein [Deltaproteobacteria bacterium]